MWGQPEGAALPRLQDAGTAAAQGLSAEGLGRHPGHQRGWRRGGVLPERAVWGRPQTCPGPLPGLHEHMRLQ